MQRGRSKQEGMSEGGGVGEERTIGFNTFTYILRNRERVIKIRRWLRQTDNRTGGWLEEAAAAEDEAYKQYRREIENNIKYTPPQQPHTHTHHMRGGQPGIKAIPDCDGSCVGRVQRVCVGVDDEFCALTTRSTLLFKNTTINHLKYKILLRVISQMKIFPRDPTEIRSDQVTIMCGRGTVQDIMMSLLFQFDI